MDKSNKKKGPKAPSRKKRLQLDIGTSSLSSVSNPQECTSTRLQRAETREQSSSHQSESVKQPNSTPTGATSDETRPKSTSPEPNCAICLGKLENKSFTDSCFHMFCFVCLEEWSKVKAECPLCKQTFKSIIHNVRSLDDYDQHHVQTHQRPEHQLFGDMLDGRRFRYRTTVTDHRYAFAHLWENERHRQMLQRPSRYNPVPNWRRLRQPANSEFRRSIYQQKLKAKQDQVNTRRRVRETSPSFFRDNPAQTHRLVPWLNRELNALLDGHGSQVAFVLDLIMGLIKRYEISSDEFYEHVYPFIGRNTRQFMEEFINFARSPHQMAAYDRATEYEPQATTQNHDSESDSDANRNRDDDDGNDSDVVIMSPPGTSTQPGPSYCPGAPERISSTLDPWERTILGFPPMVRSQGFGDLTDTFLQFPMRSFGQITALSGWDSPTPSSTHFPFTDTTLSINGPSSHRFDFGTSGPSTMHDVSDIPLPSSSAPPIVSNSQADPITCHESDTESNGSDIMIVDYEKPWNERSPIKLSSAEESDYEVMITGTSYPTDPVKKEHKKKKSSKSQNEGSERIEKRKRSAEEKSSSTDRHKKKKKRKSRSRSRSRSIPKSYRPVKSVVNTVSSRSISSRSRSRSPIRMKLPNYSNYVHKKYNYHRTPVSTKPFYRSRLHRSISCSSSESNSDAESHVSIRSRKEKSRSGNSSIEIVEYRKKKSKFKSGKRTGKSGSYDKEKQKHKRDKHDRKHKKSKKSKHKKGKHQRKDSTSKRKQVDNLEKSSDRNSEHNSSSEEIDITTVREDSDETLTRQDKLRDIIIDGTSDSDNDSDTDDAFIDVGAINHMADITEKRQNSDNQLKEFSSIPQSEFHQKIPSNTLTTSTLELVELTPFESAAFDKDLDDITRYLPVTSNLDGDVFSRAKGDSKSFKKHPHGHKKSNKKQTEQTINGEQIERQSNHIPVTTSESYCPSEISTIQSSDITSCTDIDQGQHIEKQKLSLHNGENKKENTSNFQSMPQKEIRNSGRENSMGKLNYVFVPTSVYESPTSSGYPLTDLIDVETLSESSDATKPATENAQETAIDVENLSDSDSAKGDSHESNLNAHLDKENQCFVDVLGLSDKDFDIDGINTKQDTKRTIGSSCYESDEHTKENYQTPGHSKTDSKVGDVRNESLQNKNTKSEIEYLASSYVYKTSNCSVNNGNENSEYTRPESAEESCDNLNVTHSEYSDSTDISDDDTDIDIVTLVNDKKRDDVQVFLPSESEGDTDIASTDIVNDSTKIVPPENDEDNELLTKDKSKAVILSDNSITELTENSFDKTSKGRHLDDNDLESDDLDNETMDNKEENNALQCESPNTETITEQSDIQSENQGTLNLTNKSDALNENTSMPHSDTPILTVTNTEGSQNNIDQQRVGQQLSIDWTANQGFLSSSSNETGDPFVPYGSSLGEGRSALASPSYMETLYDRRTSGFGLSPDLTFESISQSSPGQLSPVSTLSDNGQDNFVPED